MCGIAGILQLKDSMHGAVAPARLDAAMRALFHRGPDDAGILQWDLASSWHRGSSPGDAVPARLALMHRRLSIIDLTKDGWQPMSTEDNRFHLVFNGEIYNYIELRNELEAEGVRFRSRSDTEVLLVLLARAMKESGSAITFTLRRLRGMFAFGLLDSQERTLLLARDFFGIKPLYFSANEQSFAFASELGPLLDLVQSKRQADLVAAYKYLRYGQFDQDERTFIDDAKQVLPAHYLLARFDQGHVSLSRHRYWTIRETKRIDISFKEATEQIRDRFLDSVRVHLRSDVPVGGTLSGGIDSSALLMAMRRLEGDQASLHSFSFVPDEPALSEERWIDLVSTAAHSEMHKTKLATHNISIDWRHLIAVQGVAPGGPSAFAQYKVFESVKAAGIKVVLDGQGADELFAGYPQYFAPRLATLLRDGRLLEGRRFLQSVSRFPGANPRFVLRTALAMLAPRALKRALPLLGATESHPPWIAGKWFDARGIGHTPFQAPAGDMLREALLNVLERDGLPQLLHLEDRNSMYFSVESRVPFLDRELAELAFSLPPEYLLGPDGESKRVLRAALRGLVPDAILDRRDKIGFAAPSGWFRAIAPDVLSAIESLDPERVPILDLAFLRRACQQSLAGSSAHGTELWRCAGYLQWAQSNNVTFS